VYLLFIMVLFLVNFLLGRYSCKIINITEISAKHQNL